MGGAWKNSPLRRDEVLIRQPGVRLAATTLLKDELVSPIVKPVS